MASHNQIGPLLVCLSLTIGMPRGLAQSSPAERLSFRDPAAVQLKAAISAGDLEIVQKIVSAAPPSDCLELDEQGRTALEYAVQRCAAEETDPKPFEVLKVLAGRAACVNAPDRLGRKPILELEPLSWTSRARMDALQILIAAGADVNAQDENGTTLLHQLLHSWDASSVHWPEVLDVLAKAGANPNLVNSAGRTPLHEFFGPHGFCTNREGIRGTRVAVAQKVFTLLNGMGAKLSIRDKEGTTPVGELLTHYEGFFGTKETLLEFASHDLAKLLDLNSAFIKNRPALVYLCDKAQTDPDLIERLLDLGANPKMPEQDGFTALHGAAWFYNDRNCNLLLEHGAEVNALDDKGRTPLHELARSNFSSSAFLDSDHNANIVKAAAILLTRGADRRLKDNDGKRAVDLLKPPADPTSEDQAMVHFLKRKLKP